MVKIDILLGTIPAEQKCYAFLQGQDNYKLDVVKQLVLLILTQSEPFKSYSNNSSIL